jgi:hypothetical protein
MMLARVTPERSRQSAGVQDLISFTQLLLSILAHLRKLLLLLLTIALITKQHRLLMLWLAWVTR